jgi:hypothetical protein
MLRGSVAQSRAIPSMSAPLLTTIGPAAVEPGFFPPLPMAEDEDPDLARQDRISEEA